MQSNVINHKKSLCLAEITEE